MILIAHYAYCTCFAGLFGLNMQAIQANQPLEVRKFFWQPLHLAQRGGKHNTAKEL